jgi:hypothetical protein
MIIFSIDILLVDLDSIINLNKGNRFQKLEKTFQQYSNGQKQKEQDEKGVSSHDFESWHRGLLRSLFFRLPSE